VSDEHFTVDGTLIEAWAGQKSFKKKEGSATSTCLGSAGNGGSSIFRSYEVPPLRGGSFQGIGVYRPMKPPPNGEGSAERGSHAPRLHRLDEPTGLSLGSVALPQSRLPFHPAILV
jgi:hypothetical protein